MSRCSLAHNTSQSYFLERFSESPTEFINEKRDAIYNSCQKLNLHQEFHSFAFCLFNVKFFSCFDFFPLTFHTCSSLPLPIEISVKASDDFHLIFFGF